MVGKPMLTSNSHERKAPKVLKEIAIMQGENGGHIVEHRFEHYEHPAEPHVFGKSEGPEAIQHIAEHAKIDIGKLDLEHESEPEHGTEEVAPAK